MRYIISVSVFVSVLFFNPVLSKNTTDAPQYRQALKLKPWHRTVLKVCAGAAVTVMAITVVLASLCVYVIFKAAKTANFDLPFKLTPLPSNNSAPTYNPLREWLRYLKLVQKLDFRSSKKTDISDAMSNHNNAF